MIINELISCRENVHIIEKKFNQLSFGYYKFISAANSLKETASSNNHHTMERRNFSTFFKGLLLVFKKKRWGTKRGGYKKILAKFKCQTSSPGHF